MNMKMQRLINRVAKSATEYHLASAELDMACRKIYGATPSDIECDTVLDLVYGQIGACRGVTFEIFDQAMKDRLSAIGEDQ
tara:strand:+ start:4820 stop:5062 length:243 start_codon:yes stop_codon:yes gene_type:complete